MASQSESVKSTMTPKEQQFIKALGARIAQLRQEQGYTQKTLADELGIAQQTLAHYEVGRLRMPITLLPEIAQLFAVPVDELLGLSSGKGKRGPAPRLQQQIERLSRLPKAKQRVVMDMLEGVLQS
jgi:DNA-binding XRE family transcriptional regulator